MTHVFRPGEIALVVDGPARGYLVEVVTAATWPVCGKYCEACPCDHPKIMAHKISRLNRRDDRTGAPPHWLVPVSDPDDRSELRDELCGVKTKEDA